jgi:hypothetical protein
MPVAPLPKNWKPSPPVSSGDAAYWDMSDAEYKEIEEASKSLRMKDPIEQARAKQFAGGSKKPAAKKPAAKKPAAKKPAAKKPAAKKPAAKKPAAKKPAAKKK